MTLVVNLARIVHEKNIRMPNRRYWWTDCLFLDPTGTRGLTIGSRRSSLGELFGLLPIGF